MRWSYRAKLLQRLLLLRGEGQLVEQVIVEELSLVFLELLLGELLLLVKLHLLDVFEAGPLPPLRLLFELGASLLLHTE